MFELSFRLSPLCGQLSIQAAFAHLFALSFSPPWGHGDTVNGVLLFFHRGTEMLFTRLSGSSTEGQKRLRDVAIGTQHTTSKSPSLVNMSFLKNLTGQKKITRGIQSKALMTHIPIALC